MSSAIYLSRHPAKIFELGQDSSHRCRVCFGVPHDIHATHFSESEGKFVPGPEQGSCLGDLSAQELFGFSITVFSTHHSREKIAVAKPLVAPLRKKLGAPRPAPGALAPPGGDPGEALRVLYAFDCGCEAARRGVPRPPQTLGARLCCSSRARVSCCGGGRRHRVGGRGGDGV